MDLSFFERNFVIWFIIIQIVGLAAAEQEEMLIVEQLQAQLSQEQVFGY